MIKATSSQGDIISVSLAFSALQSPSVIGAALSNCQIDTSRALVERVDVTAQLDSSLPVEATFYWNADLLYAPVTEAAGVYLLSLYSDGPTCDHVGESGNLAVHWASIQSGSPGHFTAWWIFNQAISPAKPQGDSAGLGQILLAPQVLLAGSNAQVVYSGERYVQCSQNNGLGQEAGIYLAGSRPALLPAGVSDLTCH